MRRTLRSVAVALAVLAFTATSQRASADDAAEADLHFEIATQRYRAGDWIGALEHYLASNRLSPNRRVMFDVARCYEELDRRPDAYRAYEDALDGETNADQRTTIEAAIARLAPTIALLDVVTEPVGATLYLQRKDLGSRGTTPRRLGLSAGTFTVLAELPGYEPATKADVTVVVGQVTRVVLKLVPILGTVTIEGAAGGPEIGAEVRVDDAASAARCRVPCTVDVPPGKHTLSVSKAGFATAETIVDVQPKITTSILPTLSVLTGALIVSADLTGAVVEVDGHVVGFTPTVAQIPVGTHFVRVSRAGFRPFERTVVVAAGQDTPLSILLADAPEVIGASRRSESVADAPASITIIGSEELRAMAYPTIAEAVRGVRGIYLTDDGAYVSIGARGSSPVGDYGNHVLILVDGHSTNDDYIGSSYVGFDARVDLADIERIEIIRGPGSVVYGTGAFSAVINLVTRNRDAPTHVEAGISSADAGAARARVHATLRGTHDDGLWLSASAAYSRDGRTVTVPELAGLQGADSNGTVVGGDGFKAYTFSGKGFRGPWSLQAMWTSRDKTLANGDTGAFPGSTTFRDTRGYLEGRFEPKLDGPLESISRVYLDTYLFHGVFPRGPAVDGTEVDDFHGLWAGAEQRVTAHLSPTVSASIGGEAQRHFLTRQEGVDATGTLINRSDPFTVTALYGMLDWTPTSTLHLSPALRVDDYSNVGASVNPRLSAIWRPTGDSVLKLLLGKAFRAPSVYELHYVAATQIAPTNLRPEDIWSAEIEASQRFADRTWVTFSLFTNYVPDPVELLGSGTTTDPNYYANASRAILTLGSELEVRREWREGWMLSAQVSLQHSHYVDDTTGYREVPNSPWLLAGIKAAFPIIDRILGVATRASYVSPRWDRDEAPSDPAQQQTPSELVWDLMLHGEVDEGRLHYSMGVYNLLGWRGAVPVSAEYAQTSFPTIGRTLMVAVDVRR